MQIRTAGAGRSTYVSSDQNSERNVIAKHVHHVCRAGAMTAVAALCAITAGPVVAQEETAAADEGEPQLAEVLVTGSRIARRDFTANSPITTVEDAILENTSSFALESKLLQLPQFAGASNSQFSTGYFNSGAATLNLRNLGDNRNLVLLDGRRLQPSTTALAVDINTIPAALIDSIEVITGGASAAYGADAVSGVVNFKLKRDFQGLQIDSFYGLSERGDNRILDLSAVMGGSFAEGRGNAVVALSYADRGEVKNGDIPFLQEGFRVGALPASSSFLASGYYNPLANQPSQAALDAYFAQFGAAPGSVGRTTQLGFNNDASSLFNVTGQTIYNYQNPLFPRYVIDTFTNPGSATVKQNFSADTFASLPLTRHSVFATASYDLTDSVELFSQVIYTRYESTTAGGAPVAANTWRVDIPRDAAHPVPDAFAAILDSRPDPNAPWALNKDLSFMGLGVVEHTNDVFQFLAGARGVVPNTDITWDLYASHGETQLVDKGVSGFASLARYRELMTAPNYGANYKGQYGTCTSGISPFGEQNGEGAGQFGDPSLPVVSADCIDYLNPYWTSNTRLNQDVVELTFQGKLLDLPAGEARFALGTDYRSNSVSSQPDKDFAPDAGFFADIIGQFGVQPVSGTNSVKEVFGEALIPLLSGLPGVELLELNLGYRYSDYNHSGGSSAYKADLNWQVSEPLRFRGGYQRAVRAPNVVEQFGPPTLVFDSAVDACKSDVTASYANIPSNPNRAQVQQLCRALMGQAAPPITDPVNDPYGLNNYLGSASGALNSYPRGNPDVKPEKADTYTAGVVFSPSWQLPANLRFSGSVDYYKIDIEGAIGYVNANLTYQLCFNANGVSNPTYDPANIYCQTIGRQQAPGAQGVPSGVFSLYLNQGSIITSGVDLQGNVRFDAGPGVAGVDLVVNYLDSFKRRVGPGAPLLDYAGFAGGYYEWKSYTNFSYTVGDLATGLRWRHLPSVRAQDYLVAPCTATRCFADTPSYDAFDLYASYRLGDMFNLRAGVDNLLDEDPPVTRGIPGSTDPQTYDIIGRRYYFGITANF
ncbi:MAG: TonB-dependent receptor [Steroidobacteraceae bacterium]|nr:TonB-dependent receptor [Steroidobacteraceae bacterium]